MSFKKQLIEWKVCQDAIDWVKDRTLEQAWSECPRGDWMLWLLEEMEEKEGWLNEKEIMLLSCWCARRALKCLPKEEKRALKAIEAKEKWTRGEMTREEMLVICNALYLAACNFRTSTEYSTAYAISCFALYSASSLASYDTAYNAAHSASYGVSYDECPRIFPWSIARSSNFDKESLIQADYIRSQFALPIEKNA